MHFKVKQQTYNWQSELSSRAHKAVKAFFHCYENFASAANRADYVKWVVPEAKEIFGSRGDSIPVAPSLLPYMWASVEDGPNGPVSDQSM